MRHLCRKQKNMIRRWVKKEYFDKGAEKPMFFDCCKDWPEETYDKIANVMQFECFDSHVDRFIDDIKTLSDCKII